MSPNGCGPWWYPGRWKDRYFLDACNQHDQDYLDGEDQEKADRDFYERMIEKVKTEKSTKERIKRRLQAYIFYHVVRRFGKHFFRGE